MRHRGGIRHWVLEVEIKKAHERQAVADQILGLLIREIVERLQHHDLELQDRIVGLATSVALALLGLRLGHALDVSAQVLPPHDLLDRFQRITFGADRLKPALNIEKARLPHDSLAPSAHGPLPSASQIRSDLARRIFRGALITVGQKACLVSGVSRTPSKPRRQHTWTGSDSKSFGVSTCLCKKHPLPPALALPPALGRNGSLPLLGRNGSLPLYES